MTKSKSDSGILSLYKKVVSFEPSNRTSIITFAFFLLISLIISVFHEPWLDEAQAWLIARDASYYDMIFVIPHYEGHPPLWQLILSIPAKLGLPYEASLTGVMLLFSGLTAYMIMFRSPFKGIVRLLLPFTYFFFYQYGIIARPYVLMAVALVLAAYYYKARNEKPFPFVLSLMLLCGASAFGIIISGGIAIAWCIEILQEYKLSELFTKFTRTRRFAALLLLLATALLLIFLILSNDETFTNDTLSISIPVFFRGVFYMLFMLPADCLLMGEGFGLGTLVKYQSFRPIEYAALGIPGILLILTMFDTCRRRRKVLTFTIPLALMAVFGSAVYFTVHHQGIAVLFYVFVLWVCFDSEDHPEASVLNKITPYVSYISYSSCCGFLTIFCLASQLFWSVSSAVLEIQKDYYYGRQAADYIKEHKLDELNIMSAWYVEHDPYGYSIISADKQHYAATINPYFDDNIFYSFNSGNKDMGYIFHRLSEESNQEQYALWRETPPDVIIGEARLEIPYEGTDVTRHDYVLIKSIEYNQIVKLRYASNFICIYMHKDLLDDYPSIVPETKTNNLEELD